MMYPSAVYCCCELVLLCHYVSKCNMYSTYCSNPDANSLASHQALPFSRVENFVQEGEPGARLPIPSVSIMNYVVKCWELAWR